VTPERLDAIERYYRDGYRSEEHIPELCREVLDLQARIDAALALHTDGGWSDGYVHDDGGYGGTDHCCSACGYLGEFGVKWPCATVKALRGDR
jgi:hypothetical protein